MNYMIQSYIQLLQPKFKAMPLATDFPQFRFWTPPVPFHGIPGWRKMINLTMNDDEPFVQIEKLVVILGWYETTLSQL